MSIDCFDKFNVGDSAQFEHLITYEDVENFAELTGDNNPLHLDETYAQKTSLQGIVAHGMLGASFVSTIIGKKLPGPGALWMSQNFNFQLPVRIGDRLRIEAKVKQKNPSQRTLHLETTVSNQNRQKVITGSGVVKVMALQEGHPKKSTQDHDLGCVIVTGGNRGIGASVAKKLAQKGHDVLINYYKNEKSAYQVCEEISQYGTKIRVMRADVRDFEQIQSLANMAKDEFPKVVGLVNNASSTISHLPFNQLKWNDFEEQLAMQLKGPYNLIKSVLPFFIKNGGGAIVNIGTIYADDRPPEKMYPYIVSKAALAQMTKCLAMEFGPKKIRFNTVSPGMTQTTFIRDVPEKIKLVTEMQTPLRKLACPDEVADAICFLIGSESKHITGETLRVCGGAVML